MAEQTPLTVSVILPTFNRADVLARTVGFVTAQTYRPIQLVIVNDGSSDATVQKLVELEPVVRDAGIEPVFITKENGGCASARNEAMKHVVGDYFAFLDDDDEWLPTKLEKQMAELQRTGADACCSQTRKLVTKGEVIHPPADRLVRGREPGHFMDGRCDAHLITLVVKTALWKRVGEFDTALRVGSDFEWIARLCHHAEFCAVPEILAVYNYSELALSRVRDIESELRRDESLVLGTKRIREHCSKLAGWDEQAWCRRTAGIYDECVKHMLYAGDLAGARTVFAAGMQATNGTAPLPRVRRKICRARWLALVGKRLKHPKLKAGR